MRARPSTVNRGARAPSALLRGILPHGLFAQQAAPARCGSARVIVFHCQMANDPAMMTSTRLWNSSLNVRRVANISPRRPPRSASQPPCPNCSTAVTVPNGSTLSPPLPPSPRAADVKPVPPQNPLCRTCGQGALSTRKTFRMSGPVVVIGFILLIPSVLGMLFGIFMLFITGAASTQTSVSGERKIRAAQDVPEPIIAEVIAKKSVGNAELESLSPEKQSAIHDAQLSASAQRVGAGAATVIVGGFSLFIVVASFVGGLLGWLLMMRKRVLQCVRCGAVVAAS